MAFILFSRERVGRAEQERVNITKRGLSFSKRLVQNFSSLPCRVQIMFDPDTKKLLIKRTDERSRNTVTITKTTTGGAIISKNLIDWFSKHGIYNISFSRLEGDVIVCDIEQNNNNGSPLKISKKKKKLENASETTTTTEATV